MTTTVVGRAPVTVAVAAASVPVAAAALVPSAAVFPLVRVPPPVRTAVPVRPGSLLCPVPVAPAAQQWYLITNPAFSQTRPYGQI